MKELKVAPLGARILVKQDKSEEVTAGGIIIPTQKKIDKGKVVAVGPGDKDNPINVNIGETVFFEAYAGQDIESDGEKYLVLKVEELIARDL